MKKPDRTPPRKYLSRNEQFRLLFLVGGLMLVFILMNEARKPETWALFAPPAGDDGESSTASATTGEASDATGKPERTAEIPRLPGEIEVDGFRWEVAALDDDLARARRRAEKEFWQQQMELLPWEQRNDLPRVLKAQRDNQPLDEQAAQAWQETLETLNERWDAYAKQAMDTITTDPQLSVEDRGAWLLIIQQMQAHWNEQLHGTLAAAADPTQLTERQRATLAEFSELFDEMSLERVKDGTVVSWPADTHAWFRLFEKLQTQDLESPDAAEAPRLGHLQLSEQPDEHRGKLVKIRGLAPYPYHVPAPKNILGIKEYFMFTVFPRRGPSTPILVYALEVPAGFPVAQNGAGADKGRLLEQLQEVEFVGYSFKRCAYASKGGTEVAPLVLAKAPRWSPKATAAAGPSPSWWMIAAAIAGAAALGAVISVLVYWRHSGSASPQYGSAARATPAQIAALNDLSLAPSPAESMAEQDGNSEAHTSPDNG